LRFFNECNKTYNVRAEKKKIIQLKEEDVTITDEAEKNFDIALEKYNVRSL
jgi:maltodextrin utilization protein YvdJ